MGPLRPKTAGRRDSRGIGGASWGWRGRCREEQGEKREGCAKSKWLSMKIGRKRMNGKGVTSKCSRDHSLREVLAGNPRVPFPRAPSCYFGHQRAPVFQKYYGKVTSVSNVFHFKRTPVKLICIHVYIKTVPKAGDSILISTMCPWVNTERNDQPLLCFFICKNGEVARYLVTIYSQNKVEEK